MSSVKIRDSALNAIKRYVQISKSDSTAVDTEAISTYWQLLEEQWVRFCKAQEEVELSCGEENASVEEQARVQAEEWYSTAKANFKRLTTPEKQQPPQQISVQVPHVNMPLPKLQLPSFSGDPTEWLSFHDTFCSLVNANASLSDGQKLQYLRNCLKGEALDLVRSLAICDSNYSEAWELLTARYKVIRVIVESHVKALASIEKATKDSAKSIKLVLDATLQHVGALRALKRPVEFWDDWLVHLTVSKLAHETRKQWELSLVADDLPSFNELREFLETRARSLEMVPTINATQRQSTKNVLHSTCTKPESASANYHKFSNCLFCKGDHKVYSCSQFSKLDPKSKLTAIKKDGACLNCLSKFHILAKCQSTSSCRICQRRHHTLLHSSFNDQPNGFAANTTGQHISIASHYADADRVILLATAEVLLQDNADRWQPARALLDSGSHASFITESCAQRLRLPRKASSAYVTGIGSSQGGHTKGVCKIIISPRSLGTSYQVSALVLPKITNDLPATDLSISSWAHLSDLNLADPNFFKPGSIDILIGMDEMDKFLLNGLRKGQLGTPMAQNTAFGWVLFGNASNSHTHSLSIPALYCDTQLTQLVSRFWALEELAPRKHYTPEENQCEKLFNETTQRADDGRYIVRLPFKEGVVLGESRNAAVRSLLRMEKRFASDAHLQQGYKEFMKELLDLGHMELAGQSTSNQYYMPHHAVVKDTSETTKLRVVFNASMNTSSGYSLNDALMVGPQLQQDLFSILVRFRTHRYGLIADVAKMYRQVYVASQDTEYQRIVWRDNVSDPIQDYKLLRVTYGVASASYLAIKSLQRAAADATGTNESIAKVVTSDFYMDDLLTGSHSIDELTILQRGVSNVLSQSGFELRKWATNCSTLRERIPHASKEVSHLLADGNEIRTLGVIWCTGTDSLSITVNVEEFRGTLTKRVFLSDASKVFDPLGLIAPCTIRSKIWLQGLWRSKVDWDEPVPPDVSREWFHHRNELRKLASLKLNRWLGSYDISDSEFHLFTDASELAYAAALYCRTLLSNGEIHVVLVAAKTKVAPIKTITLPRLELCAAYLGAKLVRQVQISFGCTFEKLYAWTDSMVTLAWLQSTPSRWSVFVANRVAGVQEALPAHRWRHVSSEHNPADCASRGITPSQLLTHPLWWHGPQWLRESNDFSTKSTSQHTTELELKSTKTSVHLAQTTEEWELLSRYSSYTKLKRITALLMRFIKNARSKAVGSNAGPRTSGPLTCAEIRNAELALVKYTQTNAFQKEISHFRLNKPIPVRSSLIRLQPFLDDDGIIRVGGRLEKAALTTDVKHPIILPKASSLAKAVAAEIHVTTLHAGPQIMQTMLQRRFWVPGMRNLLRGIYRRCIRCRRLNHKPSQQVMGDLPTSRVTNARCFLHSAVDFAGPYTLKFSHGRGAKTIKAYICAFICMSTGAMHLELASDLSSLTFVAAFKRFTNRRGHCQHVYSDNGTNFVGADRELQAAYERCITDKKMSSYFADIQTTWHFNPPSAPHMGGFWETGVKRVKYHLKRALGPTLLTYEEFTTILTEVEGCVNSRPICWIPTEVEDFEVLTPGHFIIGEPLRGLPDLNVESFKGTIYQRWQTITTIRQHFWKRWRDEYLVNLQKRTKWFRPKPSLQIDDVVVIHDNNAPPTKWKLGRVMDVHPGNDGYVRVVNVRTSDGDMLRPVVKLSLLPTKTDIFDK